MSTLLSVTRDYRKRLLAGDEAIAAQIEAYWARTQHAIMQRITQLTDQMAAAAASGQPIKPSWLHEQNRLKHLLPQVTAEVNHFASMAQHTVLGAKSTAASLGAQAGREQLYAATADSPIPISFHQVPSEALYEFAARASNGSPLDTLFQGFGAEAAANVKQALFTGITLGHNPLVIARDVMRTLDVSRARARTVARQETLSAFRRANMERYRANSDVVSGWRWLSAHSANTCAMCLAMDGTIHDLDEDLDSHVNCRCVAQPITKSYREIFSDTGIDVSDIPETSAGAESYQTGEEWLVKQPAAVQIRVLGKSKYAAYQAGDLSLDDLVGVSHDQLWGTSRYEKSMRQLGLDPAKYPKGA